jgi:ribosomal protein S12 methylthiotransferase
MRSFERPSSRVSRVRSENDHAETLKFLETVRFDHMGAFTYSREEGTAAYRFPPSDPGENEEETAR